MRLKLKPAILISGDADAKYRLFAPDENLVERWTDGWSKQFSGIAQVAATTTKLLSLGDVVVPKGLWLSASVDCLVKLNGATPALQLRRATIGGGDAKAALVVEADITSIEVTAGADVVDIVYAVWGDTP